MPLHDVARERRGDPPRDILIRSEQRQPTRVNCSRNKKRWPVVLLEPRLRSGASSNGERQAGRRPFRTDDGPSIANFIVMPRNKARIAQRHMFSAVAMADRHYAAQRSPQFTTNNYNVRRSGETQNAR